MSTADAPEAEVPDVPGPAPRILLIRAPYYRQIVDGMTDAAVLLLGRANATVETVDVAGAFELP